MTQEEEVTGERSTLLTQAIQIRTQGVGSEVLLPQTGGEEMHVPGRMGIDALQDIDQIDIGIDALETTRRWQVQRHKGKRGRRVHRLYRAPVRR
jgi:hypothetical protein